jgi:hypothetical protein
MGQFRNECCKRSTLSHQGCPVTLHSVSVAASANALHESQECVASAHDGDISQIISLKKSAGWAPRMQSMTGQLS